jgi:phospholipase C
MRRHLRKRIATVALGAMLSGQFAAPMTWAQAGQTGSDPATTTPIKHLIVLIGENRSYDNVFGTYLPKKGTTANLLSKGIVTANGSPGINSGLASQDSVNTPLPMTYFISSNNKTPYTTLPTPELNGTPNVQKPPGSSAPFDSTVSDAELAILEPSLEVELLGLLRTGASGAAGTTGLDTRIIDATICRTPRFRSRERPCLTIRTPATRCIASITCGSSRIATAPTRR